MVADARTALFLAMISTGLAGCTEAVNARALDRICATQLYWGLACEIEGIGNDETALTEDSAGFVLHDAALVIHLEAADDLRGPGLFDISLLTRAHLPGSELDTTLTWGKCLHGCPADPPSTSLILPTGYAWVTVASGIHGSAVDAPTPYDAVVSFAGLECDIIDLRISATP